MSNSLEQKTNMFDGLKWSQVQALVDVLRQSESRNEQFIKRRYNARATNFSCTFAFLLNIGLVKQSKIGIVLQEQLVEDHDVNLQITTIEQLFHRHCSYRTEIIRYLNRFKVTEGDIAYRPDVNNRSKESAVRNFLMEMDIVRYDSNKEHYVIASEYIALYMRARSDIKNCSPSRVLSAVINRDKLGRAAEIAVVKHEKERLGKDFANLVDHVALRNAAAGYDVLSATVTNTSNIMRRYIEVKAVSLHSFQFHWTHNEVQIAQLLGSSYYLYLLPVGTHGNILTDRLVQICNPYDVLLTRKEGWIIEQDVLLCSPQHIECLQHDLT
jgi:hypothetical protein